MPARLEARKEETVVRDSQAFAVSIEARLCVTVRDESAVRVCMRLCALAREGLEDGRPLRRGQ